MQIDAFKRNGIDCELIWHNRTKKFNKLLVRLPYYRNYNNNFIATVNKEIAQQNIRALYIRKYIMDASFLRMLKTVKKIHNDVKILLEIPTYPYDAEWNNWKDWPMLIKDRMARKELHKYVDVVLPCGVKADNIFNIPSIYMSNGINIQQLTEKNVRDHNILELNLIGVALVEKWHGYDRLINGLANYYKDQKPEVKVIFHIVGAGGHIPYLKSLVRQNQLEKYVVFYGPVYGKELDAIFDKCDIGVGSLGAFRKGISDACELKLREYVARGIPFIYSNNDESIESIDEKYRYKLPHDESIIDVTGVVQFYKRLIKLDARKVIKDLRDYAGEYLTWEKQMKKVSEWLMKG